MDPDQTAPTAAYFFCDYALCLLNRKFHISQISHREKLVPIRHIFYTNNSHFVKCGRSETICSIHAHSSHR